MSGVFLFLSFSRPPFPEDAPLPATCRGSPAGRTGEALRWDQRQMAERSGSKRQGQILEQIQRRELHEREGEGGGVGRHRGTHNTSRH